MIHLPDWLMVVLCSVVVFFFVRELDEGTEPPPFSAKRKGKR